MVSDTWKIRSPGYPCEWESHPFAQDAKGWDNLGVRLNEWG